MLEDLLLIGENIAEVLLMPSSLVTGTIAYKK